MHCRFVTLACTASAWRVVAWTTASQAQRDPTARIIEDIIQNRGAINRLWNFPEYSAAELPRSAAEAEAELASSGLGSSITYARDTALCGTIGPLFGDDLWGFDFSPCDEITAALRSAFDSWADNHPRISFVDVTNECVANAALTFANSSSRSRSNPCPLAQVWLTTTPETGREDPAATTVAEFAYNPHFRHTNGRTAAVGAYQTIRATIAFKHDGVCWYLDVRLLPRPRTQHRACALRHS